MSQPYLDSEVSETGDTSVPRPASAASSLPRTASASSDEEELDNDFGETSAEHDAHDVVVPLLLLGKSKEFVSKGELEWREMLSEERTSQRLQAVKSAFHNITKQVVKPALAEHAMKRVRRVTAMVSVVKSMHKASTIIQKFERGRQARNLRQELTELEARLRDEAHQKLPARKWLSTAEEIPQYLPTLDHLIEYSFTARQQEILTELLKEIREEEAEKAAADKAKRRAEEAEEAERVQSYRTGSQPGRATGLYSLANRIDSNRSLRSLALAPTSSDGAPAASLSTGNGRRALSSSVRHLSPVRQESVYQPSHEAAMGALDREIHYLARAFNPQAWHRSTPGPGAQSQSVTRPGLRVAPGASAAGT